MLSPLISLYLRGLSVYRWNTFPRIEQVTVTDSTAYTIHVALLMAELSEAAGGKSLDRLYIILRLLFGVFFVSVHSDISAELKETIREKRPDIARALENAVYDRSEFTSLPENIRMDILKTRNEREKYSSEESLIVAAKLWVNYQEARINDSVYTGSYSHVLYLTRQRYEKEVLFSKYLALDPVHWADPERFLMSIRRLQSSFRWNRMRRIFPVSVMSHLGIVTFLSYLIGRTQGKNDFELTQMLLTALFHDIPEAITGDVITPTKKCAPGLEELLAEIETELVESELLVYLGDIGKKIRPKMLTPWSEANGDLVKIADTLCAYWESVLEAPTSEEFAERVVYIRGILENKRQPFMSQFFES